MYDEIVDPGRTRMQIPPQKLVEAPDDLQLVRDVLGGSEGARELLGRRLAFIPALVRRIHGRMATRLDRDELNEVAQNVALGMWKKLEEFDGRRSLEAWAYGFCTREIMKFGERRGRRSRVGLGLDTESVEAPVGEQEATEFARVHMALDRLASPSREIVGLKLLDGLTFQEIAVNLGMSTNTAKTRYYRALVQLRDALAPIWEQQGSLR